MRVGGIVDISTKDIPNRSTMVIFTVGCNLSCGFCHNKYLLYKDVGRDIGVPELMEQIKSNMLVSAVSISGGEPTLQKDLLELCREINQFGKYVSIDTNGTKPSAIKELLPHINRIALDLKGPLNNKRLAKITGNQVNSDLILQTFNIVNSYEDIDFEIRTTYVENLIEPSDIDKIIAFLKKNRFKGDFVLQQYQYSEGVGEDYKEIFQQPEHITLLNILKPYRNKELSFQIYLRDNIIGYCKINELYEYLDE
ncbi:MAG: anaerobic ribonucleoside-triphosphate reductase activating protein [Candidatus Lokiarchaeota archaeon]|nr:anaerobic ribonucleoside-triphosphate reductase activating protein [Candidatus Lokiarchaeota archaeon]